MVEYIEREKALKECDWYANEFCECEYAIMPLKGALEIIPAADVRPVVLCRDCRHWEYDAIFFDGWCRGRQQGNPNWYCADGEKREES